MDLTRDHIIATLRAQLTELTRSAGGDASGLADDHSLADAELLDSGGLLEFYIWFEETYDLELTPENMTLDNLGSLAAMADFALAQRARL